MVSMKYYVGDKTVYKYIYGFYNKFLAQPSSLYGAPGVHRLKSRWTQASDDSIPLLLILKA